MQDSLLLQYRLMLIDIYIKFLEDILNKFKVTERTRFFNRQSSKGNNSNSINARGVFLRPACQFMFHDLYIKFCVVW